MRLMFVYAIGDDAIAHTNPVFPDLISLIAKSSGDTELVQATLQNFRSAFVTRIGSQLANAIVTPTGPSADFVCALASKTLNVDVTNFDVDTAAEVFQTTLTSLEGYAKVLVPLLQAGDSVGDHPVTLMSTTGAKHVPVLVACISPRVFQIFRSLYYRASPNGSVRSQCICSIIDSSWPALETFLTDVFSSAVGEKFESTVSVVSFIKPFFDTCLTEAILALFETTIKAGDASLSTANKTLYTVTPLNTSLAAAKAPG